MCNVLELTKQVARQPGTLGCNYFKLLSLVFFKFYLKI